MKKIWPALAFALSSLGWSPAIQAAEVLVSAAVSLTDALMEIGKTYESNGKARVRFNFGSSSELARQIDEGAPADIFFSADLEKMDALAKKGRIDPDTRKNLLSNRLVLVVPQDSKLNLRVPKDLLQPEVKRIALAQPETVPVGIYVKTYLESEGLWAKVASKIIPVLDVRATLTSVESGNVDAGFVYKTDAAISKKTKVVYEVPLDKGPKIVYPVAAIKESKNKEAAGDFLKFVSSQAGKNVFRKYGFIILE
jgi:molybdate transport system substrate-binding protein